VRTEAARALGRIGPEAKSAVPALNAALKDREPLVAREAAEALKRIAGAPGSL
jgi:HEAT repeat protein